jgi:hypothetical protein
LVYYFRHCWFSAIAGVFANNFLIAIGDNTNCGGKPKDKKFNLT